MNKIIEQATKDIAYAFLQQKRGDMYPWQETMGIVRKAVLLAYRQGKKGVKPDGVALSLTP